VSKHCGTLVLSRRTILKTVRDSCKLQPNALSIKLSDQIEQLDQLITAEANPVQEFSTLREVRFVMKAEIVYKP
jgi:hypothetical protein